eukprot:590229_1
MPTFRRRKDASTTLKVLNAVLSWVSLAFSGCWPWFYSNGNWPLTMTSLIKLSALSAVSPLVMWLVDISSPSDAILRNMKEFRDNHYTLSRIILYNLSCGWLIHVVMWFLGNTFIGYAMRLDFAILATFIFNWLLSEAMFTFCHILLHETALGAKIHLFHHCTIWPSMLQNYCFHPIDFVIELGTPVVVILFTYHFVSACDTSAILSTSLLYVWYNSSHDETRNSHHCMHHKACDGLYMAYFPYDFGVNKRELIRGLKKTNRQKK